MKCLNCGKEADPYLCSDCRTSEILDKIFNEVRFYNSGKCENPYLIEFASALTEKYAERDIIPDILALFPYEVSEYYYCQYFRMRRDSRFEESAIKYLQKHDLSDIRAQNILYNLIDSYLPNDFIKPKKWCELVADSDALCCELYAVAAKYFAMIGEYDLADEITNKGINLCNDVDRRLLLFYSPENMIAKFKSQKEDTDRYRTKRPYWPATEERRRAIAIFYDDKGIAYPRIESKPKKIEENEFCPIIEFMDEKLGDYCVFWCEETRGFPVSKGIYQIAAAKVRNGVIQEEFQQWVRPWDGLADRKYAAKKAGVELSVIETADDVDLAMQEFFAFVEDDVLVSTEALGNQAKLLSRSARYAGMKEIKNAFYDLLDLAEETSKEFRLESNTREHLLAYFSIEEGKSALEKARINKQLYDALMGYVS